MRLILYLFQVVCLQYLRMIPCAQFSSHFLDASFLFLLQHSLRERLSGCNNAHLFGVHSAPPYVRINKNTVFAQSDQQEYFPLLDPGSVLGTGLSRMDWVSILWGPLLSRSHPTPPRPSRRYLEEALLRI